MSFSVQEDRFFMEDVDWGHLRQPSCTKKGWKMTIWGNCSTLGEKKKKMRKSLISIISWISLWVTQHHREREENGFFSWGMRKKKGMRGFHSYESQWKHQRKSCFGSFCCECSPQVHLSQPDPSSSVETNMAMWNHAYISGLTSSVRWFVTLMTEFHWA